MADDLTNAKAILEIIPRAMMTIRSQMRTLAKSELTIPQFRVIARLSHAETTNAELAEWIGVTAPTMSQMVDVLVKHDLVCRTAADEDRRQVRLSLTTRGRKKFDGLSQSAQETIAERLSNLTPEQKTALGTGLAVLREIFL